MKKKSFKDVLKAVKLVESTARLVDTVTITYTVNNFGLCLDFVYVIKDNMDGTVTITDSNDESYLKKMSIEEYIETQEERWAYTFES